MPSVESGQPNAWRRVGLPENGLDHGAVPIPDSYKLQSISRCRGKTLTILPSLGTVSPGARATEARTTGRNEFDEGGALGDIQKWTHPQQAAHRCPSNSHSHHAWKVFATNTGLETTALGHSGKVEFRINSVLEAEQGEQGKPSR